MDYTYDAAGRLVRKDKGNGTSTTYDYDAAGQVLTIVNLAAGGAVNSRSTTPTTRSAGATRVTDDDPTRRTARRPTATTPLGQLTSRRAAGRADDRATSTTRPATACR